MKKVLILFGGNSSEHNISCKSAKAIYKNIDKNIFIPTIVGISKKNDWYIYSDNIDTIDEKWIKNKKLIKINNIIGFIKGFHIVFPIIHGTNGEDGKLQGMLDLFNIKYVGCKTLASAIGMDKEFSKILFQHLQINQVPYITVKQNFNIKNIQKQINFPMIIKPANGGSSIGISKATNERELKKALKEALKYDKKIIIENFICARELEVAVLKDKDKLVISDIGEIVPCNNFYDYKAKYEKESKLIIPASLDNNISEKIKTLAKKIFIGLEADDYIRVDFFLDGDNIYINEVNTIPGFTEISMYPKLINHLAITYKDMLTKLLNNYS